MKKRIIAVFTLFIFIITMVPLGFAKKVQAYSNNSYFNDLKVGLSSMASTSMSITLMGDYNLNGQLYTSGTVLNIGVSGTSLTLNGSVLSTINLIPSSSSNLLSITSNSITNKYMSSFLFKVYNGKILPINSIFIEDYLKGVVGYEMSDYFPLEALKAQAVAARNYAISRIGYETAKGYDFDDTINYQVYKGFNSSYLNVIKAVDETRGQVLLYNDTLVETLYSAWHGGVSENSENVWGNVVPYLRSVQDSYESDAWPNGNRVFTNADIQAKLISKNYITLVDTFVKLDLNSITRFQSGRVSNINIVYKDSLGTLKTKSVTKDSTRTFLSLPSNLFNVTYDSLNGTYTFSGKGYGHGLGMSQIGAKNRGNAGQTYEEILKFYYQNTYLQNMIPKANLTSFTESSNVIFAGDAISFNATASSGSGNGYLYKYVVKNDVNTVFIKDYSSTSSLDFIPAASGNYTAEVYVKDKFSTAEYDDKSSVSFNVYNLVSLSSFTLSKTATLVSQAITADANVQNGSGTFLYKYEVAKDGTVLQATNYTAEKQFTYVPDTAGTYSITLYVKDTASSKEYDLSSSQSFKAYDKLSFTSFAKDHENVTAADLVTFSAVSAGGSGDISYKFLLVKDGQNLYTRDFAPGNSFAYTINAAGNYEVYAYALDKVSSSEYDAVSKINFSVYNPSLTSVTATGTFYEGKQISFSAGSTGASQAGFSYKYEIYNNNILVASSNYSSLSTFNYTPAVSGVYTVKVYGKDVLSTKDYDSVKEFNITLNAKPLYLSVLPLKYGMTNSSVPALQNALTKLNYKVNDKSGYFGKSTKDAVMAFQKAKGLTADGIVGSMTYSALNDALIESCGNKSFTF